MLQVLQLPSILVCSAPHLALLCSAAPFHVVGAAAAQHPGAKPLHLPLLQGP